MTTITANTDSVMAVWHAVTNGKFILHIDSDISENWAQVLDDNGNRIGDAHRIYSDGWAVHTAPFAGYVNDSQVVMV